MLNKIKIGYEGWPKQYFVVDEKADTICGIYDTKDEAYASFTPNDNLKVISFLYKAYGCLPPKTKEVEGDYNDNE